MPNNSCNYTTEQNFDIVAVYPFPFGELNHQVPFNVRKKTTTLAEIGLSSLSGLAARKRFITYTDSGGQPDGKDFLIEEKGTVKATAKKTISGYTYSVNLQLKSTYHVVEQSEYLFSLIEQEHDLLLEASDGKYYFIRCPEYAYNFLPEENISDSYTTTLTFDINNINGIQPIIE